MTVSNECGSSIVFCFFSSSGSVFDGWGVCRLIIWEVDRSAWRDSDLLASISESSMGWLSSSLIKYSVLWARSRVCHGCFATLFRSLLFENWSPDTTLSALESQFAINLLSGSKSPTLCFARIFHFAVKLSVF